MQVDDKAADLILTITRLLAKSANDNGLSQVQLEDLNRNVEALIEYDSDKFVRRFLTAVRDATPDLLYQRVIDVLASRPLSAV
jgi:hypothetical protein